MSIQQGGQPNAGPATPLGDSAVTEGAAIGELVLKIGRAHV